MDPQLDHVEGSEIKAVSGPKPIVVGLYGLPGSGKTFLLNQLKQKLKETSFTFYEGSEIIANVVSGGLDAFHGMEEQQMSHWRMRAIDEIGKRSADSGKVAIVTGHLMFWSEKQKDGQPVYTQNDLDTFTHILYLNVPADVISERRRNDTERSRSSTSEAHLSKWQQSEINLLRRLCRHSSILLYLISPSPTMMDEVSILLHDFGYHTEKHNLSKAQSKLDDAFTGSKGELKTMLVMDADRTLAAEDTGAVFWEMMSRSRPLEYESSTLKTLFGSPLGYSYTAFRQAVLLYEESSNNETFDALCQEVALAVRMHPEMLSLLQLVAEQKHVGAVVVTCGLRSVWEKVLEREGLSRKVKVIGGGRIADGFVITAAVKAALIARLQERHRVYVWAFGDSPPDLEMLRKADRAVIVVGEEQARSATMDGALTKAIDEDGLQAQQAMLPRNASPRLDTSKLPVIDLTKAEFVESVLSGQYTHDGLQIIHNVNENAVNLLATPMRDAALAGPNLRKAHRHVGWYLAIEFLPRVVGLEQCRIQHVLGRQTRGYRLFHEEQTTIVALMRGGEPMASGVSDAFPLAMFVHARDAEDIKLHHLRGQLTVVLVDSVVNTGKTIIEFVTQVRKLHATIRIVVVAGVVQAQCDAEDGLPLALARYPKIDIITLRLSETKFTGSGTTDTGNRLFNTTHLP